MKRFLVMLLILGLLAGSVATAGAKKGKKRARVERTVEGSYGAYPAPVTGCNEPLGSWACLVVKPRLSERFFTAKVKDAHGQPVFVEVWNGDDGVIARFCGETTKPIAFDPYDSLEFHVALENWPPSFGPNCLANRVKTTGTISVTLSNRP